jgi:hypothetical protein
VEKLKKNAKGLKLTLAAICGKNRAAARPFHGGSEENNSTDKEAEGNSRVFCMFG